MIVIKTSLGDSTFSTILGKVKVHEPINKAKAWIC